jgi:small subunit ribosomal protein S6
LGVIIDPEIPPEEETSTLERLEGIITKAGGEVAEKDAKGRRQLAYPINKKNYGVYHFWKVNVGGEALEPLNFEMRTNDAVIRSLILNEARAAKKAAKVAAKAESAADGD